MGIKWLDKSHRSPVSCKEISREQVANRLQSRCKQGFRAAASEAADAVQTSTHDLCFRAKIVYTPVNPNFTI